MITVVLKESQAFLTKTCSAASILMIYSREQDLISVDLADLEVMTSEAAYLTVFSVMTTKKTIGAQILELRS